MHAASSRQLGVAAAAATGNSALVWLLPASTGVRVDSGCLLLLLAGKVCVADRQGQKHPPEARMIRSGQLALRWPNSYCQACDQGNWGVLANVARAVDARSVDRVVGLIQGVRAGEGGEDVAAALRPQRS